MSIYEEYESLQIILKDLKVRMSTSESKREDGGYIDDELDLVDALSMERE